MQLRPAYFAPPSEHNSQSERLADPTLQARHLVIVIPLTLAALFERGGLMTPQLSQRLWVDAKNSRHIGRGHPFAVVSHGGWGLAN